MAAFQRVYTNCLVVEDIYPGLARRFQEAGIRTLAELGGGRGPIAADLSAAGIRTCVVDLDGKMLAESHRPVIRGDISALPIRDGAIDGAAAVNCLYFLADPRTALREAFRVLRRGGLFAA
jgi:ubiquinone/menaquinone biosynthesis C-methylase UbiE